MPYRNEAVQLLCVCVNYSGLMAEVDYVILDEWYRWIVDNHPCHIDQIGLCLFLSYILN